MNFGHALKKTMDHRGVSQAELARRLGYSKQMVNYHKSRDDVKVSTMLAYCDALGVSYQKFMREGADAN
jgi:transcriptional regulator with XRE-family HTH domain